jgi:hypothetical protein
VHGVVAARDAVDHRRNPIFLRPRDDCQILDEAVCYSTTLLVFSSSLC